MNRTLPGVNYELASAVRRVNALYETVPEDLAPDVTGERWKYLEREIDEACGRGDREAALLAIRRWEEHASNLLRSLSVGGGVRWLSP